MADRSQSRTMIVSNTPEKSYDYNNRAYCSKLDSENLRVPGLPEAWVLIGDSIVLTLGPYGFNPDGCISLNAIQRRNAKSFTGDSISVSMFIPPENFNLALLSVELELANKDEDDVHVDAILFSKLIRKYLVNQVMTVGQRVLYDCCGVKYIFTVNQAVLAGKGRSNGIERGMISADTRVVFTAPLSSGIQVLNQREPTSSNIFQNKEVNLQPFDLERCRLNGILECGPQHDHIYRRTMLLAEQVKVSEGSPLITCLLEGPRGSGKTAMAATVGIRSDFPYVKLISAGTMIRLSEPTKCAQIVKVFEDAYKSPLSIIILDNIERLLGYVPNGPRFSDLITQTLLVLLSQLPPKGKKLLVIGTTSEVNFLESVGIRHAFTLTYHVPTLKTQDAKKVLQQLNVFSNRDIDSAAEALNDMPLKKLYMAVEMAAQGKDGGSAEAIYDGRKKINVSYFYDCLQDMVRC